MHDRGWNRRVDVDHRHRHAMWGDSAQLHAGNVDLITTEDGADFADDPWRILVREHQHIAAWNRLQAVIVDSNDPWLLAAEERASHLSLGLIRRQLDRNQAAVVLHVTANRLTDTNPAFLRQVWGVDHVDVVGQGFFQEPSQQGGGDRLELQCARITAVPHRYFRQSPLDHLHDEAAE